MSRLAAAVLAWWCSTVCALELVVATNEYPPYVSSDPRLSFIGELFDHIGKDMGVTFRFRYMPWKRCVAELDANEVWGVVHSLDTPYFVSENVLMLNRSPANAALLARFNRALETLRRNGVYDGIVSRRKLVLATPAAAGF